MDNMDRVQGHARRGMPSHRRIGRATTADIFRLSVVHFSGAVLCHASS
jgi:hypothetical protein